MMIPMIPNWILYPLAAVGLVVVGLFLVGLVRGVLLGLRLRRQARAVGAHRENVGVSDTLHVRKIPADSPEGKALRSGGGVHQKDKPMPSRFPSPHPFPQIFYGPQVDRLRDKGVDYWIDFQKRHGFHGILLPCANLPLDHTGIRALVERNPGWTLIRLFGDEQHRQVPSGGLLGEEAMTYYRTLYRLLGDFGPEKWGVTVGFDPFEWTTREELSEWVDLLTDVLDPFGDERMVGARARTRADEPPNSQPNPGTYAPWAIRVIDKSQFRRQVREAVADSGGLPTMAEDGFRKRPGGRQKDWTELQMLAFGFESAMKEEVGATWGNFSDEGGEDGCIDWRNVDEVRAILSPGNGNGNGEPPECCVLACESGAKIREIRVRVETILSDLLEVEDDLLAACDASPDPDPNPDPE